ANDGGPAPIVYCPDEDEVAHFCAPDFTSWLYRLMLEELACTGLTEHIDVRQSRDVLAAYSQALSDSFHPAWNDRLDNLLARPYRIDANDYHGVLDENELRAILSEDLAWPRLDEEFEHYLGN
ncbi:MAG: hypothetical protein ACYTF0_09360, partial [Planctomycetota bacterium]